MAMEQDYWTQFQPWNPQSDNEIYGGQQPPGGTVKGPFITDPLQDFRDPREKPDPYGMPRITESPQDMLERYRRDYWAEDRDQQLARLEGLVNSGAGVWRPNPRGNTGFPGPIIPGQDTAGGVAGPGLPPRNNPNGQEWNEQRFTGEFGRPGTPQDLIAMESRLNAAGIQVLRNAAGVAGKIQLPNGQIVDIINAAGAGGRGFQWLTGDGGSESGAPGSMGGMDGYGAWTEPYGERYELPSQSDLEHMPGYQAGLKAYRGGIETSAAARGTLLTGGTMQRLGQASTDYANQAYGQLAGLQGGAFDRNYNVFRNNQTDPFNKYYSLAELGRPR